MGLNGRPASFWRHIHDRALHLKSEAGESSIFSSTVLKVLAQMDDCLDHLDHKWALTHTIKAYDCR